MSLLRRDDNSEWYEDARKRRDAGTNAGPLPPPCKISDHAPHRLVGARR